MNMNSNRGAKRGRGGRKPRNNGGRNPTNGVTSNGANNAAAAPAPTNGISNGSISTANEFMTTSTGHYDALPWHQRQHAAPSGGRNGAAQRVPVSDHL